MCVRVTGKGFLIVYELNQLVVRLSVCLSVCTYACMYVCLYGMYDKIR